MKTRQGKLSKVAQVPMEPKMEKKLTDFAKKEGRTFTGLVRHILTAWLKSRGAVCLLLAVAAAMLVGCSNPVTPKTPKLFNVTLVACGSYVNYQTCFSRDSFPQPKNGEYLVDTCIYYLDSIHLLLPDSERVEAQVLGVGHTWLTDYLIVTKDTIWQPKIKI